MSRAKRAVNPVVGKVVGSATDISTHSVAGRKPSLTFPLPSLSNVRPASFLP